MQKVSPFQLFSKFSQILMFTETNDEVDKNMNISKKVEFFKI